jgi:hypothetical protein
MVFRLKNGRRVARALKRRGYRVQVLRYPYPVETPTGEVVARFEAVEASKLCVIRGRYIRLFVGYEFDRKDLSRERCEVTADGTGVSRVIEGDVTAEKVLRAILAVKKAAYKVLWGLDKLKESKPLGEGFATREWECEVTFASSAESHECKGDVALAIYPANQNPAELVMRLHFKDIKRAVEVSRKIVEMLRGEGLQFRPLWL